MSDAYQVIGETAGKVYKALEKKGAQTLSALQKEVDVEAAAFNQALGWLAREGKLKFVKEGRGTKVSL